MDDPADPGATRLRDGLDRLADSVSTDGGTDGAQLYRRSLRRRRRRVGARAALVAAATAAVVVGGSTWQPGMDDDGAPRPDTGRPAAAGQGDAEDHPDVLAPVDDPG